MKSKPLIIRLIGWGLVFSPIFYYLQSILQRQMRLQDFQIFWEYTNLYRLIGIILGPIVGYLVLSVRPIGWYSILGYALYTIFVNIEIYSRGDVKFSFFLAYCVSGLFIILIYLVRKEVNAPYFNPTIRWWENAERFPFNLEVTIHRQESDDVVQTKTFDISYSGCFLETDSIFEAGDEINFKIKLLEELETTGLIMWVSDGKGRMPKGLGIRFTSKHKEIKTMVNNFTKQFKQN